MTLSRTCGPHGSCTIVTRTILCMPRVVQVADEGYADRVFEGAQLGAGMTVVDIGAGEGLVAFRAIERIGPSLRVMLTDVSAPMLRYARIHGPATRRASAMHIP